MEHEVYPNIDKPMQFMGRNIGDWITSLLSGMMLYALVLDPLIANEVLPGIISAASVWLIMTGITAYRDNMPPHLAYYAVQWMSQGDNYVIKPDPKAVPVLTTAQMIEEEKRMIEEQRELVQASQQDRAARRRGRLPQAQQDDQ